MEKKLLLWLRRYLSEFMSDFYSLFAPQYAFAGVGGGMYFSEGNDNGWGDGKGEWSDDKNNYKGAGDWDPKAQDKTPDTIPYDRFKEVNDKMKSAEAELAKFKQKEDEQLKAQEEADQKKALEQGEHLKVIEGLKAEKEALTAQQEVWKQREETQKTLNASKLEGLKSSLGDKFPKLESFISGIQDPFELASKLDDAFVLFGSKSEPKGGSSIPEGSTGKLAEYKEKLAKGEVLSPKEQSEYIRLLSK